MACMAIHVAHPDGRRAGQNMLYYMMTDFEIWVVNVYYFISVCKFTEGCLKLT
jgi:hypothetical protein